MIIGLAGHAGYGKSTACAQLLELLAKDKWKRAAFATPLKSMVAVFGGVEASTLYTNEGKAAICPYVEENGKPVTFARVLQIQGMVFRERLGGDVWVRACLDNQTMNNVNIIVEDVRFPNEVDAIRKRGGIIIKLVIPDNRVVFDSKLLAGRDPNDQSEIHIDKIVGDYTIVNDITSGKDVLRKRLEEVIKLAHLH